MSRKRLPPDYHQPPSASTRPRTPGAGNTAHGKYAGVLPNPYELDIEGAWQEGESHRGANPDPVPIVQHKRGTAEAYADPFGFGEPRQPVQLRLVDDIDAPAADSIQEDRATISGSAGGLSPRQLAKAQQRNQHWAGRLGFSPSDFGSSASVESAAFANDVARFQTEHGLAADGIAGPKTDQAASGRSDQLEDGVLGADDELEAGVLGAGNYQLEGGLIGMDDPMFTCAAPAAGRADQLESGLIDEAVQGADMDAAVDTDSVHAAAAHGIQGATQELPFRDEIEAATGHDLSGVKAHIGGAGAEASAAMGAEAYATGDHVVFAGQPDKHTAAHEAAHVIQQRGGVQLKGGVGEAGDSYEQQADAVGDAVVRGESARDLVPITAAPEHGIQMKRSARGAARAVDIGNIIQHGRAASRELVSASLKATALLKVIDALIRSDAVRAETRDAYDRASDAYAEAKRPSNLQVFFSFVTTLSELGLGGYGIYKGIHGAITAVRQTGTALDITAAARRMGSRDVGDGVVEIAKATRDVGKNLGTAAQGGKSISGAVGGAPVDLAKQLIDVVAYNSDAANAAFLALAQGQVEVSMIDLAGDGARGYGELIALYEDLTNVARDGYHIPEAQLSLVSDVADQASAAATTFADRMLACQQLWSAYQGGGREALVDEKERGVFETVAEWRRTGDPRADGVHVAGDERRVQYNFDIEPYQDGELRGGGVERVWTCHAFGTEVQQSASGELSLSADALRALEPALQAETSGDRGVAQRQMQRAPATRLHNVRRTCSASLAKSLAAIGVHAITSHATVTFNVAGETETISGPHSEGSWFEQWWDTPNFSRFWGTALGGRYGFLYDKQKSERIAFMAGIARQAESTRTNMPDYSDAW